jgi:hypothetical protein
MISAYARAAQVLGDEADAAIAAKAADFVLSKLATEDGRLLKRYRQGEAGLTAHLEDYAFLIRGLLDLYETNFEVRYFEKAVALQKTLDDLFWDVKEGGYFTVAKDAEALIVRAKKLYGGAIPSGNAVSIGNLARLHRMTGNPDYATRAEALIRAFSGEIVEQPAVYPETLCGLDFHFRADPRDRHQRGKRRGRHEGDDRRAAEGLPAESGHPPAHAGECRSPREDRALHRDPDEPRRQGHRLRLPRFFLQGTDHRGGGDDGFGRGEVIPARSSEIVDLSCFARAAIWYMNRSTFP